MVNRWSTVSPAFALDMCVSHTLTLCEVLTLTLTGEYLQTTNIDIDRRKH